MQGKKIYVLYKRGIQCGSPYSSKKSLDAAIAIDRKFYPHVALSVETFEVQSVGWEIVPIAIDKVED